MATNKNTPVPAKSTKAIAAGKKTVARARRQPRIRISPGTWIFIILLIAAFSVWNFYYLPRMGQITTPPTTPQVFQVAQHDSLDVVNIQLRDRKSYLSVSPMPVTAETGKSNPFE
jgi:hypothetical protein